MLTYQGGLQDPQAGHAHLLLVGTVAADLGALAEVDDRVGPVEGFDDVQACADLSLDPSSRAPGAKPCPNPADYGW